MSGPSITALVSGTSVRVFPPNDRVGQSPPSEAPQPENGDSHLSIKPAEAKSSENPAEPNGTSNEPVSDTKQEHSNTGEKRELEVASPTKSGSELTELNSKKQKTSENNTEEVNGASATAHTEKAEPRQAAPKKRGRPRKTKDSVKNDIPTDGIGSRTRSRTKVVP